MLLKLGSLLMSSQPFSVCGLALISRAFITRPSSHGITQLWRRQRHKRPWLQRLNRMWLTPITEKSFRDFRLSLTLLMLSVLILLTACATQKPVAVSCPRLQVDSQLLQPAQRQAQTALQDYLEQLPPNASRTKPDSMH